MPVWAAHTGMAALRKGYRGLRSHVHSQTTVSPLRLEQGTWAGAGEGWNGLKTDLVRPEMPNEKPRCWLPYSFMKTKVAKWP